MLGLFALRPAVLDRLELSLLDARFRLRGAVEPQAKVVVLAIDESSIDRLGRWPWPRRVIADLLDRLAAADVAAVGLDLVFSEPEDPPGARTLRDARARLEHVPGGERVLALRLEQLRGDASEALSRGNDQRACRELALGRLPLAP